LSKENSRAHYEKLASILGVLGDPDALRILDEAKNGFKSGKTKLKELKLTPRKYYRNLKELNDTGIIESSQDTYKLTHLGELLHKILLNDISTLLLADQSFPEIMQKIGSRTELTVIDDYKNLINVLETSIDKSKTEILLATRYLDLGVIQSIVYALDRNVKLKTITSEKIDFSAFIKLTGSLLRNIRPNLMRFSLSAGSNYRTGEVPLSFVVIDEEITIFEIPNNKFRMAFVSTDKKTVRLLTDYFGELWNQSPKLRMPTL
jgi:predicted transcriptional regulator